MCLQVLELINVIEVVRLLELTQVFSVNLVTPHVNLFIIHPRGELQLSVQISMASDWSISTGQAIGLGMQGQ